MTLKLLKSPDEVLAINDLPTETVECPEWDCSVLVRGLTGTERDEFEASIIQKVKTRDEKTGKPVESREVVMTNARAKLVSLCVVNEAGERIFTKLHLDALGKKSGKVLDRLYDVARRLSGIGEEAVEELVGNSEPDQPEPAS